MPRKKTATATKLDNVSDLALGAHKRITTLEGEIARLSFNQALDSQNTPPVDKSKEVAALVGLWIDRQKAEGATTVDLKRVDDIRTGIELALT